MSFVLRLLLITILVTSGCAFDTKGCVSLDALTFDKVVDGHRPVLVRFDKKWSLEKLHKEIAERIDASSPLLIAEVEVAEYGEKENSDLAKRFKVNKEDYPAFLLFKDKPSQPLRFPLGKPGSADAVLRWVRSAGQVWVPLAGLLDPYEALVSRFMASSPSEQGEMLKEAEGLVQQVEAAGGKNETLRQLKRELAEYYTKVMDRISKEGPAFAEKELARVEKLSTDASVKKAVQDKFALKANIALSFVHPASPPLPPEPSH